MLAAPARDLGKACWPEELFAKPAYLVTNADLALIRAYPIAGVGALREAWPDAPEEVVKAVLEQHERPGGSGYPRGAEPSRAALLVAACDVVDAMASDRGYRPALPLEKALAEVRRWAPPDLARAVEAPAIELRLEEMWLAEIREEGVGAASTCTKGGRNRVNGWT